ncbi:MAG: hypothetical protein IJW19_05070 [Clostridia bacterium]|nr:hypothetical protein [Clostridia bacterium]
MLGFGKKIKKLEKLISNMESKLNEMNSRLDALEAKRKTGSNGLTTSDIIDEWLNGDGKGRI